MNTKLAKLAVIGMSMSLQGCVRAYECNVDCKTEVTVTLAGDGCTYAWSTKSYVVKKGVQGVLLQWELSGSPNQFVWGSNDGVKLLSPPQNNASEDLDQNASAGPVFQWLALHAGSTPKTFKLSMDIFRSDNNKQCSSDGTEYTIVLE